MGPRHPQASSPLFRRKQSLLWNQLEAVSLCLEPPGPACTLATQHLPAAPQTTPRVGKGPSEPRPAHSRPCWCAHAKDPQPAWAPR